VITKVSDLINLVTNRWDMTDVNMVKESVQYGRKFDVGRGPGPMNTHSMWEKI
jgi:hypothetical protein